LEGQRMRHYSILKATMAAAGVAVAFVVAGCNASQTSIGSIPHPPAQPARPATVRALDATPTPIPLVIGGVVGTPNWPEGDTATGGQGQQIAGLNCLKALSPPYHHHAHLSLFVDGQQYAFPLGVGMFQPGKGKSGYIYHQTCLYFLHTHDQTGILHMESKTGQAFTLGTLFKLWGEPLSSSQVAQYTGAVSTYVNGTLDTTDPIANVALNPGDDITLVIGQPPAWIPAYTLPSSLSP
jgi:hypothetical protein